jgi:hypothetical protein
MPRSGGLTDLLPNLDQQLQDLKVPGPPRVSVPNQLKAIKNHRRATNRRNKKFGLIGSRFSSLRVTDTKRRLFMRWAAVVWGPVFPVQPDPRMRGKLKDRWHRWQHHKVATRFNAHVILHGHDLRVSHWHGQEERDWPKPLHEDHKNYEVILADLEKAVTFEAASWMEKRKVDAWKRIPKQKRFLVGCHLVVQAKKSRVCWNFKPLNLFGTKISFKGDGMKQITASIRDNDYAMSLDLKSFFHHFRLSRDSHRWCVTRIKTARGIRWLQIESLFFGLRDIPYVQEGVSHQSSHT